VSDIVPSPAPAAADTAPAPEPKTETAGAAIDPPAATPPKPDAISSELRKSNKELREAKLRLEAFEKAEADRAAAGLSEAEKYKLRAEELESKYSELETRTANKEKHLAFKLAATAAGVVSVTDALKLADLSALDFDDNGEVIGVDETLDALKQNSPYLFQAPKPPSTKGGGNPASGPPKYSPEQIRSLRGKAFDDFARDVRLGRIKL